MTVADELLAGNAKTAMGSDLMDGLRTLALNQEIEFRLYTRVVLPLDGWVFWVRADLLAEPSFQQGGFATASSLAANDAVPSIIEATGSLHYTADARQEESENYVANRVVFASTVEIQEFTEIAPTQLWIGEFGDLRFAFSSLSSRFVQAGVWHYSGFAVYPDMLPQVIDQVTDFNSAQVVNNSLPAWLQLATYRPVYATWSPLPPFFPSFLAPQNQAPPFATIHVQPDSTRALASAPTIDPATSTHTQLCAETVRVTLWGARNNLALDFIDAVNQYSSDTGAIGVMNMPVFRDEKRTQAELGTIAQKKMADFDISYLQHRMNRVAKQVIRKSIPNFYVNNVKV